MNTRRTPLFTSQKSRNLTAARGTLTLEDLETRLLLDGAAGWDGTEAVWALQSDTANQNLIPAVDMLRYTLAGNATIYSVTDVGSDSMGNIYVAGNASNYSGTVNKGGFKRLVQGHSGQNDGFVAKFDTEGVGQWITFLGGSEDDTIGKLHVDGSGGVWIAGDTFSYDDFPGYENAAFGGNFLAKLSSDGGLLWTHSMSESQLNASGVLTHSIGVYSSFSTAANITFTGNGAYSLASIYEKGAHPETAMGVVSFSASGSMTEVSRFDYNYTSLPNTAIGRPLIQSPTSVITLAPHWSDNNDYLRDDRDYDVMRLTPGSPTLVGTYSGVIQDAILDSQGNVLVAGITFDNVQDTFIAKHGTGGQQIWRYTIQGSKLDSCHALAIGDDGTIYFSGDSWSPDFPFVNSSFEPDPDYSYSSFFGALTPDGEIMWNTGLGKIDDETWYGSSYYSGITPVSNGIAYAWDDRDWDSNASQLAVARIVSEAGEDSPSAALVSEYLQDNHALLTEINTAKYLDVQFADTQTDSVNGDELRLGGDGAAQVALKGKPKLIDKATNTWRYTVEGLFGAGPVILDYLGNSFTNSNGQPNASASQTFYAIPDLAPLAFSVEAGAFEWNELKSRYVYEGEVSLGLKPAAGQSFAPLITLTDGEVSFDQTRIYGNGVVSTAVTGSALNLFEGDFEFLIGQSQTNMLLDGGVGLGGAFKVAGLDFQLTQLALAAGQVQTQGTIHLPTEFGSVELAVGGNQALVLAGSGVSLTGSTLTLPNVEIDLPWLKMEAESLSAEYIGATVAAGTTPAAPDKLRLRGKVTLPDVFNATADLTKNELAGTDGYLEIDGNGEIKWFGKLSVEEIVIVPGRWEVKEAWLELREGAGGALIVQGGGKAVVPPGMEIIAGLGFLNEEFNFIQLGVGDLNIPIGATGAFLQDISGSVNNIANPDATQIVFGGGLGFTAGPKLTVSLPDWAGGNLEGSLAEFGVEGGFNMSELTGTGTLKMVGGLAEGTAVAALNWDKGTLTSAATLTALDGLITIDGKLNADSKMNITINGQGRVTIPSVVPLWGGRQIGGANTALTFTNDGDNSNDFVAGWGSLTMSILGKERRLGAGLKVNFDGSYSFLGSKETARTQLSVAAPVALAVGPLTSARLADAVLLDESQSHIATYTVADETEWLLINAQWEGGTSAGLYLLAPDGTRYEGDDFTTSDKVALVDDLSGEGNQVLFIDAPDAGLWQLVVESDQPLTGLQFGGYQDSVMPTPAIDAIQYNGIARSATIAYSADGSLSGYRPAFYYDTDAEGADGILIGLDTDGDGTMIWNTSGVAAGNYYVYVTLFDDTNAPVSAYYAEPITVTAQPAVTTVAVGAGQAGKVTYTDADGTVVTVAIKGDSGVLNFSGDSIVVESGRGKATVSGTNLFLQSIELDGAGLASLSLSAKGGDNQAEIGTISGGDIKALSGKNVLLQGNVELNGELGAMKWSGIDDNVAIRAAAPVKGIGIKATTIGEQVRFEIDGAIKSLAALEYGSGSITADSIGKIAVKLGDFGAAVTATDGDLLALSTGGSILGDISAAGMIKAVATKGALSATLRAGTTIGKVAAIDLIDGVLSAGGDIASVSLKGTMANSWVMAGYDLGGDLRFGGDDLAGSGNLGSVSVSGQFAGSYLLAGAMPDLVAARAAGLDLPWVGEFGAIKKIKLGSVDTEADDEFGLYAADSIKPFKIGKTTAVSTGSFVIQPYR